MFVNTEEFRREALHFQKYGYYCPDPPGSAGYAEYWAEQLRRCEEGWTVGGTPITGDHYQYLNFNQIKLTRTDKVEGTPEQLVKSSATRRKIKFFPDFWDADYSYYQKVEEAKAAGKHLMVGKARRKGFSYKNAAMAANQYNTVRDSYTLLCAYDKKFLYPKGIMTMATDTLSFFNQHTAWKKRRHVVNKQDIVKASYLENIDGQYIEKGYKSIIQALTFKDNPDAARGKDGNLIIFEECGAFDNLYDSYMATRPCVEDGDVVTGLIVLFGTGGDMEGGTIDFEMMFYDPDTYNLLPVENVWDEGGQGTFCSFFVPSYQSKVGFIDAQGNSLAEAAKESERIKREHLKANTKNPGAYDKQVTEYPWCPKEAFRQTVGNIFPAATLQEWRNQVVRDGLHKIGVVGELFKNGEGVVRFRPNPDRRAIDKFPHDKGADLSGAVVVYQTPYRDAQGRVPDNLYYIEHDPFGQDGGTGGSLGAAYVKKRINNFSQPDDMIVASWVARPPSQDAYNEVLFMLAEYFNARIGFENDRGEVIPYARRTRSLRWLMEEVEIFSKADGTKVRKLGRTYGCSMGSEERKGQAELYLRDWLMTPRGTDEHGNRKLNLHYIFEVALLEELIKYNRKGNFDRVSALLVGQMHAKATYFKTVDAPAEREDPDDFFNRNFFDN